MVRKLPRKHTVKATAYPVDYFITVLGRILVGGFFLWNGIDAVLNFSGTTLAFVPFAGPNAAGTAVVALVIEILASLALITGIRTRAAALTLVFFVVTTAAVLTNFGDQTQMAMFYRNMAIVGGLLCIAATEPKIS